MRNTFSCVITSVVTLLLVFVFMFPACAAEPAGANLYQQICARCHGPTGEGAKAFPHPLLGNRSLAQLTRYIARTMPEDAVGTCVGPDAEKVATYIFDAFYSPAAQARIKAPRLELARLTVNEYRQAIADLIGGFPVRPNKTPGNEHGLRGEYFTGGKRNRTPAVSRIDPIVHVDFGVPGPGLEKLNTPEIAADWQGAVVSLGTGWYDFIVRTEHSTRFWVNDMKKPLIDAAIKSGNETEFRGTIYLLSGRAYPVRLEFSRGNVGVRKDPKEKLAREKTTISLEWKPPQRATEIIPQRNLIPDLTGTSLALSVPMPPDDRSAGYERGNAVSKEWVQAVTDGAIETARYVVAHLPELSGVRADAPERKKLLQDYCVNLAERAFRRPLTPEQRKIYVDRQFEAAKDTETAVKRVLLLVLQSPCFLYREAGPAPSPDGDAFDVAARLSFGLWDSLPDPDLIKAAATGRLKTREDVIREAERMILDRRAKTKLLGFFLQWLKVDQIADLSRDAKLFPGFDAGVVADLRTSLELFLEETMWSPKADYRRLILEDQLYLNGRLAKFYGADLPAAAPFRKVSFKSKERAGVLTHPLLLANLSYTSSSSPIHRGVFLARNILGVPLRPPADAFAPLSPDLHPNLNTRERIALQTRPDACRNCHGIINPLGFTLENFDAIGRFRDKEKDRPIDASGSFVTRSGEKVNFKNVQELAQFVAGSDEAQQAFVARLFHHTVRQPILAFGPDKLVELRRFFTDNQCDMRRLLIEIMAQSALPERQTRTAAGEKK